MGLKTTVHQFLRFKAHHALPKKGTKEYCDSVVDARKNETHNLAGRGHPTLPASIKKLKNKQTNTNKQTRGWRNSNFHYSRSHGWADKSSEARPPLIATYRIFGRKGSFCSVFP